MIILLKHQHSAPQALTLVGNRIVKPGRQLCLGDRQERHHEDPRRAGVPVFQQVRFPLPVALLCFAAMYAALIGCPAIADDAPAFEVHEWSVWVGEPQAKGMNSQIDYLSAMPGLVETERSRRREPGKSSPSAMTPLSVMTLYGQPPEFVDLDLKVPSGRPIAHWPKSEGKSNRLRWLDLKVTKELLNPEGIAAIPAAHWFHQARDLGGLYLNFRKGGRIERFLTYDLELQATLPARVDGGPDQYKIANISKHKLNDVLLIVPDDQGVRVGWLDVANAPTPAVAGPNPPPAQPNATGQPDPKETVTDITLSERLKPDSEEFQQKTSGELKRRLTAAGMTEGEVELLHSLYAKHFFDSNEVQLVLRLSSEALDEITPLAVEPETAKVKRVALMVGRKVDPRLREDVQKLIANLGDASYAQRENAEKRLKDLGRLAIPNLKEALKNKDLEVVMRAERLLLGHKEQLGTE